jgi:hypothetical protein
MCLECRTAPGHSFNNKTCIPIINILPSTRPSSQNLDKLCCVFLTYEMRLDILFSEPANDVHSKVLVTPRETNEILSEERCTFFTLCKWVILTQFSPKKMVYQCYVISMLVLLDEYRNVHIFYALHIRAYFFRTMRKLFWVYWKDKAWEEKKFKKNEACEATFLLLKKMSASQVTPMPCIVIGHSSRNVRNCEQLLGTLMCREL